MEESPMRPIIALALLPICPALAFGQLNFTAPTANLGELRGGPVYQHRFEFVNDSANPIEITDIRLGCGCLQPVLDQRFYQPGAKGTLLMNIRTLGQPDGPRTWQAHVAYRQAGKLQETPLIVAATIRNEVTVEPSIIAMTVETTLRQELTITDHRMPPLKVVNVLASAPAIRIQLQPAANGVTKAIIEVSGSALSAARQEEMLNIYTDDPYYRLLQVPITLTKAIRPAVSAAPDKVELFDGGSVLVRLRSSNDQAVRVESAVADHSFIRCTWAAGPGNDATLKITLGAEANRTPIGSTNVRVRVGGTTLTIPVALRKE
jgi:Protein of unknown function (DUF1573)